MQDVYTWDFLEPLVEVPARHPLVHDVVARGRTPAPTFTPVVDESFF